MNDKMIYFDVNLVRKLQEEVIQIGEEKLQERNWKYRLNLGFIGQAPEEPTEEEIAALRLKVIAEIQKLQAVVRDPDLKEELNSNIESFENGENTVDEFDYELSELYDLGDSSYNIWVDTYGMDDKPTGIIRRELPRTPTTLPQAPPELPQTPAVESKIVESKNRRKGIKEDILAAGKGPIDTGDGFGKLCPECYKPIKDCICQKDIPEAKQVACEQCGKMVDSSKCTPNHAQEQGGVICNCCSGKNESIVITESKSEWFAKEKLAKLKTRLTRVRQLYKKNPKESEKYEREGVALESDIEELEDKIKEFQAHTAELKRIAKEAGVPSTEVKEDVETLPATEPITKPSIEPTPTKTPLPRVPNWPQPNVNPKPKAKLTPSQEAFVKARESKIIKVAKKV